MKFTLEEIEYYNRKLEEGEEWQRTHGNKQYTFEEVMDELNRIHMERTKGYSS